MSRQAKEFLVLPGGAIERKDGAEKKYSGGLRFSKDSIDKIKTHTTAEVARKLKMPKKKIYELLTLGVCSSAIILTKQLRFSNSDIDAIVEYLRTYDDLDICDQYDIPDEYTNDDNDDSHQGIF
jgi:hypothetical protein